MVENIKSVFDEQCGHLEFNNALARKISTYRISFEMRNQDHIEFFGGNLTGVQVVRFLPEDRDNWFERILEVNEYVLNDHLESLPSVDKTRIVTSDAMNLSFVWLMHRFYISTSLTQKQKEDALIDIAMVMQFKFLTSRLYRHFRFPADPKIAAAVYAQLSYKFLIKQHGSWKKLLLARSQEITSKNGIHFNAISKMDQDNSVTYLLSDSQGRIRDMLKNIYDLHIRTRETTKRVITTSSVVEHDGQLILKDVTKALPAYTRYIHSTITDKRSFIRSELTSVIEKLVHTMSPRMLLKTLEWISDNYRQPGAGIIEDAVTDVMVYSLDYLKTNRTLTRNSGDLAGMLSKLRGSFQSSRNTDDLLVKTKDAFEKIVTQATGSKHPGIVASVRTGVMLYIVARTLTMHYYTTSAVVR